MSIKEFKGEYRWLSNFYLTPVEFEGITYPSSEHAYQASKTTNARDRKHIMSLTCGEAKRYGKRIKLRPDWESIKLDIMGQIVMSKFSSNDILRHKLLSTGDTILQEGNWWRVTFWGVDIRTGQGENHLGLILTEVRSILGCT